MEDGLSLERATALRNNIHTERFFRWLMTRNVRPMMKALLLVLWIGLLTGCVSGMRHPPTPQAWRHRYGDKGAALWIRYTDDAFFDTQRFLIEYVGSGSDDRDVEVDASILLRATGTDHGQALQMWLDSARPAQRAAAALICGFMGDYRFVDELTRLASDDAVIPEITPGWDNTVSDRAREALRYLKESKEEPAP